MNRMLACAFVLALAAPAAASKEYPDVIKRALSLKSLPVAGDGCQLCHKDDNGGLHTINKRFATTLEGFGLTSGDPNSLIGALRLDQEQGSDSDGDGIPDIEELQAGTNPNVSNAEGGAALSEDPASLLPTVGTGCALPRRGANGMDGLCSLIVIGAAALMRRLRAPRVNNRVVNGVGKRRER
jgi:hypothetical protein